MENLTKNNMPAGFYTISNLEGFYSITNETEIFVDADLFGFWDGDKPTIDDVEKYFNVQSLKDLDIEATNESCEILREYVKDNFDELIETHFS